MDDQEKKSALKAIKTQVLSLFGGPKTVAEITGVTESAISQWSGVPLIHQMKLYAHAKATGMKFDPEVFHVLPKKELSCQPCSNEVLTTQVKNA